MNEIVPYSKQDVELFDENGNPRRLSNGRLVKVRAGDALAILMPLLTQYPHSGATQETLLLYVTLLRDIPPKELVAAVEKAQEDCEWLPTVAAIRKNYHESQNVDRKLRQFIPEDDGRDWDKIEWVVARPTKEERMTRLRETRRPGDRI